jgi:16S rRNA (cytosine1402-N4)-methyltransferase
MANQVHIPVLLNESIAALDPKPNENFIDCTFGWGGHSLAILEKNEPKGLVIGLDWDRESLQKFKLMNPEAAANKRLILENINFAEIRQVAAAHKIERINGILFDLGMSSWHVDASQKGFSFSKDELLDMRYSANGETTAADIINSRSAADMEKIFEDYGQENYAKKIAKAVEKERRQKPIKTTGELVSIIESAIPRGPANYRKNSIARIFQALRIAVNSEFENIEKGISEAFDILSDGGRMAVITFHSLEDGIIKRMFREFADTGKAELINKKPIVPTSEEIDDNPRARSAKLRAIMKLPAK